MERTLTNQEENIERLYKTAVAVNCWHNIYGNPTYKVYDNNGESFVFVDNYYICRSYFQLCNCREVKRKKDL